MSREIRDVLADKRCLIPSCGEPRLARGWCNKHWKRWRENGGPLALKDRTKPRAVCSIEGCDQTARCKGYCNGHYSRLRRHGNPLAYGAIKPRRTSPNCEIPGCNRARSQREWCRVHYRRWLRYGDTAGKRTPQGEPERFLREVVLTYDGDQCLAWPYGRTRAGYGKIQYQDRTQIVSRVVCEEVYGPPPTTKDQAAHSCHNGHLGCVAKRHLSWKTPRQNLAERDARKWVQL